MNDEILMPDPRNANKPPTVCMCNHGMGDLVCNCGCGCFEKYKATHRMSLQDKFVRWSVLHDF